MHIIGLRLNTELEVERRLVHHHEGREGHPGLPYCTYTLDFESFLEDQVPWHWHQEIEFVELLSGAVCIQTSSRESCSLHPGDLCFINARALHQMLPQESDSPCILENHLFLPEFVSGGWGSLLDSRYVSPVLNCRDIGLLPFCKKNPQTAGLAEALHAARDLCEGGAFACEFDIRTQLTEAWKILFQTAAPRLNRRHTVDTRSEERMQAMLAFIQENYMEKIGLTEIAEAATISEREAFRCFQKTLRVTPIHYLQNFRVRMAARRLLETDDTVLSISQSVGFSDNSYFGRIFRQYLHCSPGEFRRKNRRLE